MRTMWQRKISDKMFKGSLQRAEAPGSLHANIVGPIKPVSHDGFKDSDTIVDEYSRYIEVHHLNGKGMHLLQHYNIFPALKSIRGFRFALYKPVVGLNTAKLRKT